MKPEIFSYLESLKPGKNGEIQLTDAIFNMKKDGLKLYAYDFKGIRYDIGNKMGIYKANIEFGLRHPEISEKVKKYLKKLLK